MKTRKNLVINLCRPAVRLAVVGLVLHGLTPRLSAQNTNSNSQALQATAAKGDAKAQYDLGNWYEKQHKYVNAADYWLKSAQQGYAPAQVAIGSAYGRALGVAENVTNAVSWYRKAADQGYPLAEYAMGKFYSEGTGVTNDMAQAILWWKKAAEQNQVDAEAALGDLFLVPPPELGTNGANYQNYPEALRWLRRAAAHGSTPAMNNLGMAYELGLGVKMDQNQAVNWYREAAEHGDDKGQANLGNCYLDGRGVKRDLVLAYKWFKLSDEQGCVLGSKGLNWCLTPNMLTPKQLGEGEQLVLDFHARQTTNQPSP